MVKNIERSASGVSAEHKTSTRMAPDKSEGSWSQTLHPPSLIRDLTLSLFKWVPNLHTFVFMFMYFVSLYTLIPLPFKHCNNLPFFLLRIQKFKPNLSPQIKG